jgi:hypothetical protein
MKNAVELDTPNLVEIQSLDRKEDKMKLYTCTNHDSHYPVGCASVVLATNKGHAKRLLDKALTEENLKPHSEHPYTFEEIDMSVAHAVVLVNGDY